MNHVLIDLDGVIYRGDRALPGAPEALKHLVSTGIRVWFVTNNSTRTPDGVARKIGDLTGVEIEANQVFTSAMAATMLLSPDDAPVLVVGEDGIHVALADAGFAVTSDPAKAETVVVGLFRDLGYADLTAAADAVRRGARFIASNNDPTFPSANGLLPGAGAIVAAIATASGRRPEIAGKPHPAMRSLIRASGIGDAWVIGDRIDTDVALARHEEGWQSILVMTGITTASDETLSADHVVADFAAAVDLLLGRDAER